MNAALVYFGAGAEAEAEAVAGLVEEEVGLPLLLGPLGHVPAVVACRAERMLVVWLRGV